MPVPVDWDAVADESGMSEEGDVSGPCPTKRGMRRGTCFPAGSLAAEDFYSTSPSAGDGVWAVPSNALRMGRHRGTVAIGAGAVVSCSPPATAGLGRASCAASLPGWDSPALSRVGLERAGAAAEVSVVNPEVCGSDQRPQQATDESAPVVGADEVADVRWAPSRASDAHACGERGTGIGPSSSSDPTGEGASEAAMWFGARRQTVSAAARSSTPSGDFAKWHGKHSIDEYNRAPTPLSDQLGRSRRYTAAVGSGNGAWGGSHASSLGTANGIEDSWYAGQQPVQTHSDSHGGGRRELRADGRFIEDTDAGTAAPRDAEVSWLGRTATLAVEQCAQVESSDCSGLYAAWGEDWADPAADSAADTAVEVWPATMSSRTNVTVESPDGAFASFQNGRRCTALGPSTGAPVLDVAMQRRQTAAASWQGWPSLATQWGAAQPERPEQGPEWPHENSQMLSSAADPRTPQNGAHSTPLPVGADSVIQPGFCAPEAEDAEIWVDAAEQSSLADGSACGGQLAHGAAGTSCSGDVQTGVSPAELEDFDRPATAEIPVNGDQSNGVAEKLPIGQPGWPSFAEVAGHSGQADSGDTTHAAVSMIAGCEVSSPSAVNPGRRSAAGALYPSLQAPGNGGHRELESATSGRRCLSCGSELAAENGEISLECGGSQRHMTGRRHSPEKPVSWALRERVAGVLASSEPGPLERKLALRQEIMQAARPLLAELQVRRDPAARQAVSPAASCQQAPIGSWRIEVCPSPGEDLSLDVDVPWPASVQLCVSPGRGRKQGAQRGTAAGF